MAVVTTIVLNMVIVEMESCTRLESTKIVQDGLLVIICLVYISFILFIKPNQYNKRKRVSDMLHSQNVIVTNKNILTGVLITKKRMTIRIYVMEHGFTV